MGEYPEEYKLPLSEESKAAGVKWLMVDGARTPEEARKLEKIFLKNFQEYKVKLAEYEAKEPELIRQLREEQHLCSLEILLVVNHLREEMGLHTLAKID